MKSVVNKFLLFTLTLLLLAVVTVYLLLTLYPRPISPADIRELSKCFASFDKYSLVDAIGLTARQIRHPTIKRTLFKIQYELKTHPSKSFSELFPTEVFPKEFVLALDYGAKIGKMNVVLKELSTRWPDEPEKREEVIKQILKPLAIQTLMDKDWFYRSYALYVLAKLECKDTAPKILPLLQDPDHRVREMAKKTLLKLGYKVK